MCCYRYKDEDRQKLKRKLDTSLDSSKMKKRGRPPKDKALVAVQERERMMMTSVTAPHNAPVTINLVYILKFLRLLENKFDTIIVVFCIKLKEFVYCFYRPLLKKKRLCTQHPAYNYQCQV